MVKHHSDGRVSMTKGEYEKMKKIIDGIKRRKHGKGSVSLSRAGDLNFRAGKGMDRDEGGKRLKGRKAFEGLKKKKEKK